MKQLLLLLALLSLLGSFRPGEKTWVAIGDSITYLNDHPEQTGHRITKGYLTGVTEKLPYLNVTNHAAPATHAANALGRAENRAPMPRISLS